MRVRTGRGDRPTSRRIPCRRDVPHTVRPVDSFDLSAMRQRIIVHWFVAEAITASTMIGPSNQDVDEPWDPPADIDSACGDRLYLSRSAVLFIAPYLSGAERRDARSAPHHGPPSR